MPEGAYSLKMPAVLLCCCCGAALNREKRPAVAARWRTIVYGGAVLIICPRHLVYPKFESVAEGQKFVISLKEAIDLALLHMATARWN